MGLQQNLVKEILDYSVESGLFTWKTKKRVKETSSAGYKRKSGYIYIKINGKGYMAHRLAWLYMTGKWPQDEIDHINHVRDDNRWCNLREVDSQDNKKNKSMQNNNSSGFTGVSWYKKTCKWNAQIMIHGKKQHLGYFDDLQEAIKAREIANVIYDFHVNHGK